jgi:hypothetical protein
MENNVSTLLVIPVNTIICKYFINNGEQHATTYQKLKDMIAKISYQISAKSEYYFSRMLPFFADIEKGEIFEIEKDINMDEVVHKVINFKNVPFYYRQYNTLHERCQATVNKITKSSLDKYFKK